MRLGIRAKLALLLCAVALLPLLTALVVVVTSGNHLRLKRLEETFLAVATSEAEALEHKLVSDLRQFATILTEPGLVEGVASIRSPKTREDIEDIERRWVKSSPTEDPVKGYLDGPGSTALGLLRKANEHFKEVFITDRFGLLVGATNKTTDYEQGDEAWWITAAHDGQGRVFVSDVGYDKSSGFWSIEVCLPIYHEVHDAADPDAEPQREFVGVGKAVLGIGAWLGDLYRGVGMLSASVVLASREGNVIFPRPTEGPARPVEEWTGSIAEGTKTGWRITKSGAVQAFVPVHPDFTEFDPHPLGPAWTLILFTNEKEALGEIYSLGFRAFTLGLVGIVVVFLLGLILFDLNLSRRVLRIASATRRIAQGDLTARVTPAPNPEKRFGLDEIDELSVGFNGMVDSVEHSHRRITAADDLKKKFIQVAAHELRTPTTFIVGISRMLQECDDAQRLRRALRSIGAKADRLSHIVQGMFKLLPGGELSRQLDYSDVETTHLLEELRGDVLPFLEGRDVKLVLEPGNVTRIRVDRETMLDVLENLTTNAIRFTPDGGAVRVTVERLPDDRVAFRVADQGAGIPESEIPYLFEPFYSGGDAMHHSSGDGYRKRGIGLGLAVVKYFVELHGGTVEVATGPQGTTLTIQIPIRPAGLESASSQRGDSQP